MNHPTRFFRPIVALLALCVFGARATVADIQNDQIGFSKNHVFESALGGEHIDVLSGNVTLTIPIGPRYQVNQRLGYQVMLYYNSKIWEHDCREQAGGPCDGTVLAPDDYGLGFRVGFGRIYQGTHDKSNAYRFQEGNGAEHFFDDSVGPSSGLAVDGSGFKAIKQTSPTVWWEVYPGDGTRLTLDHYVNTGDVAVDGWYVTKVEDLGTSVFYTIEYVANSARIVRIFDSATSRQIDFIESGNDLIIRVPAFAGQTADYVLKRTSRSFNDPSQGAGSFSRMFLDEITYPEFDSGAGEKYSFEYVGPSQNTYAYLLARTIPTGARVEYYYKHYQTGEHRPHHVELVYKTLRVNEPDSQGNPVPNTYRWTYTRFGDGIIDTFADYVASQEGLTFTGSNPTQVRVLDPFGNMTTYWFSVTWYVPGNNCDFTGVCEVNWWDGLLTHVEVFSGAKLVERTEYTWTVDRDSNNNAMMFEFRDQGSAGIPDAYSVPINVRHAAVEKITPGGLSEPSTVRRVQYSDWTDGDYRRAKKVEEFDDNVLYRSTYTDYSPTMEFNDNHTMVEIRDAGESVVSRTERLFNYSRLACQVRRASIEGAAALTGCDTASLNLQAGDVAVANTYSTTGNKTAVTVEDSSQSFTTSYTYTAGGYLSTKSYSGLSWSAIDRTIDPNTGLVSTSTDPAGTQIDYNWDTLGRLKSISPSFPEKPTVIDYPTIHETKVRQEFDLGTDNYIEAIYEYDDLGRLSTSRTRHLDGTYPFQVTEYDIDGKVARSSEPAAEGTPYSALLWTVYDYTLYVDPDTFEAFPDPLGRIYSITAPDGAKTTTEYDGLATQVTVDGIRGTDGSGEVLISSTTTYVNDVFGRLIEVVSPALGADAEYVYDENDRLTIVRLTDPSTTYVQERSFLYDALGRLVRATNPENNTVEYTQYDPRGKLLEYTDAMGNVFTNTYDAAGRLLTKKVGSIDLVRNTYDGASAGASTGKLTKQESFKLDDGGAQVLVAVHDYNYGSANGGTSCTMGVRGYSGLNGRLATRTTTIHPWGKNLQTEYCQDELGMPYLTVYPDFDNSGRSSRSRVGQQYHNGYLWELHDLGRDLEYLSDIAYTPGGSPERIIRGNDIRDEFEIDIRERPKRIEVITPATTPGFPSLEDLSWGGGGMGPENMVFAGNESVGGGGTGESTVWDSGQYEYDMAGNIKIIGVNQYYYDALSRLVSASVFGHDATTYSMNYAFDGFGNILSRTRNTSSGTVQQSFGVDWQTNQLTTEDRDGVLTSFGYDPNGNMISAGDQGYDWDERNRLEKVSNATEGIIARYDYDASGYRVLSIVDGVETYYFRDASGRVLSEFRRQVGSMSDAAWDKDYIYALGKSVSLVKNDIPVSPTKPWITNIEVPPDPQSITLSWNAVDEPDLDGYFIERIDDGDTGNPSTFNANPEDTSFVDASFFGTTFDSQTFIDYSMKSFDEAFNTSEPSPSIRVRPLGDDPPKPTGLQGFELYEAVRLTWVAITKQDDDDLWGYSIERDIGSVGSWTAIAFVTEAEYLDTGLTNGTSYSYRVVAKDTSGRTSDPSDPITKIPIDTYPPARPVNVMAEPELATEQITVHWDPVADPDLAEYRVYACRTCSDPALDSCWTNPAIVAAPTSEYLDAAALRGCEHTYQVSAVDSNNNESPQSAPASARPRHPDVTPPSNTAAQFVIRDNGVQPDPNQTCDIGVESQWNHIVEVTWTGATGASSYNVYRSEGLTGRYTLIGSVDPANPDSWCDPSSTGTIFCDTEGTGHDYTYHVVAVGLVNGIQEESAGVETPRIEDGFVPTEATVRALRAYDGRYDFTTYNRESRRVRLYWSRVHERQLQGYHVYRRCNWSICPRYLLVDPEETHTCEPRWIRVTESPISDADLAFFDETVGGLKGCYRYMVRPVGPDFVEGDAVLALYTDLIPGATIDPWCVADDGYSDEFGQQLTLGDDVNAKPRGTRSGEGIPSTPSYVAVVFSSKVGVGGVRTNQQPTAYATISWWQNPDVNFNQDPEEDLAGFHVEMAGSFFGPWTRLTRRPVAWWERTYITQGLGHDGPAGYTGHTDCLHFRVIAVDENGNESEPGYPIEQWTLSGAWHYNGGAAIYPLVGCSLSDPTPESPKNLRASTLGDICTGCCTRLEWDPVDGADEYYIYRFPLGPWNHYFYNTQVQPAQGGTCTVSGDSCLVDADCPDNTETCDLQTPRPHTVFIERGADSDLSSDPSFYCPLDEPTGLGNCNAGASAYYVTARKTTDGGAACSLCGESPRSNIVFWNCFDDPGWAWLLPFGDADENPVFASLRSTFSAVLDGALTALGEPSSPTEYRVARAARSQKGDPKPTNPAPEGDKGLATARLVTLGGGGNPNDPPWKVLNLHTDHLGSVRLVTGKYLTLESQHDFLPFGEEIAALPDYNSHLFTGHERDRKTGLDYMLARYYSPNVSRFLSVDPSRKSALAAAPHTWHRYVYALNNPIRYRDLDGLVPYSDLPGEYARAVSQAEFQAYRLLGRKLGSVQGMGRRLAFTIDGKYNFRYDTDLREFMPKGMPEAVFPGPATIPTVPLNGFHNRPETRGILEVFLFLAAHSHEQPGEDSFVEAVEFLVSIAGELDISNRDWAYIFSYLDHIADRDEHMRAVFRALWEILQEKLRAQAEGEEGDSEPEQADEEEEEEEDDDDDAENNRYSIH